jgi:WD40 repeat protein
VAVAPDGSWLATASDDGTVLVWNPVTGSVSAGMRVDGPLNGCAWDPSSNLLGVAGDAGLYLFAFKP